MKGDNSELRRESGGAGGGIGRFLGVRILFEGTSGEEVLDGGWLEFDLLGLRFYEL